MIRSMYAAVSRLRSHQEMINVTGNNIANVNTTGFKKSTALFQDILGQTLAGASQPSPTLGGTNPAQVGLAVRMAGIACDVEHRATPLRRCRATGLADPATRSTGVAARRLASRLRYRSQASTS